MQLYWRCINLFSLSCLHARGVWWLLAPPSTPTAYGRYHNPIYISSNSNGFMSSGASEALPRPGSQSPEARISFDSPKFKLTQERALPLVRWYEDHKDHPYPSRQEKLHLCQTTQLTYTQVRMYSLLPVRTCVWARACALYSFVAYAVQLTYCPLDNTWLPFVLAQSKHFRHCFNRQGLSESQLASTFCQLATLVWQVTSTNLHSWLIKHHSFTLCTEHEII